MRILEFKHIGPFDGCFWRWEYIAVDGSIDNGEVYPVVFAEGHLTPWQVMRVAVRVTLDVDEYTPCAHLFTNFKWYDWGSEIFQEISHGYVPAFWKFAQRHNLEFAWECDECGKEQTDEPIFMAGYRGNGGVGVEVEGWLCEDCEYDRLATKEENWA